MKIIDDLKEVHVPPSSIENLAQIIGVVRAIPKYDDYKIMIDGTDEDTIAEGDICLPNGLD